MKAVIHISEATEMERAEWARQIAMYWENIAMYLNIYSEVTSMMPRDCDNPAARAVFFAKYLTNKPDISLSAIRLANEHACLGYSTQIKLMEQNIERRRANGAIPVASASTIRSESTDFIGEREQELVARENKLRVEQDRFARQQLEARANLEQQINRLAQERHDWIRTKAAQEQLIADGWSALHAAKMAQEATRTAAPVSVVATSATSSTSTSSPTKSKASFFTNPQSAQRGIKNGGGEYVQFAKYLVSRNLHDELLQRLDNPQLTSHVAGRRITGQTTQQDVWNLLEGIYIRGIKREQVLDALSQCPTANIEDPEVKNFLNVEPSKAYGY